MGPLLGRLTSLIILENIKMSIYRTIIQLIKLINGLDLFKQKMV